MVSKQMSDEWGTPQSIFDLIPNGDYFDPCPSADQKIYDTKSLRSTGKVMVYCKDRTARNWRTKDDHNGLKIPWSYKNFVNPPFSDPEPWIDCAFDYFKQFASQSIIVIPDHTDRKWFRRAVQARSIPVVFIGRHKFKPLVGQKESQPRFGTGLLMLGFTGPDVYSVVKKVTP